MWLLRALAGRWRWMTFAALFTCAITVKLGFWQLDRLAQRREINHHLAQRLVAEPLRLPGPISDKPPEGEALRALEFQPAVLRGFWDFEHERALPNQFWDDQLGLDLVAPFTLEDGKHAVLVDRGWIPAPDSDPNEWARYRPPQRAAFEAVEVRGYVRFEPRGSVIEQLRRAAAQDGHDLLPFYVTEAPPISAIGVTHEQPLPYKKPPVASIGEGVHAIAAAQWFIISAIILVGMVVYVSQRERPGGHPPGLRRAPDRAIAPPLAAPARRGRATTPPPAER